MPSARPRRGRPRNEGADGAILEAAQALLLEGGAEAVTMNAIVARSGVSRATAYRRWANREALLRAVLQQAIGRPAFRPEGSALDSFHSGIEYMRDAFARPEVRSIVPEMIGALLHEPSDGERVTFETLLPGLPRLADAYRRLAAESGLREDVDGDIVADLLLGVMLVGTLRTGQPPGPEAGRTIMDILLNGLRPRDEAPA